MSSLRSVRSSFEQIPLPETPHSKFSGWLLLFILSIVYLFIILGINLLDSIPIVAYNWSFIASYGFTVFRPYWTALIFYEFFSYILALLTLVYIFIGLARSKKSLPKLVISFQIGYLVFYIILCSWIYFVPIKVHPPTPRALYGFLYAIVSSIVWIPFFRISKQVKHIFIQ